MIELLAGSLFPEEAEQWKSAAHRFKGSAGNLGAEQLYACCKRAEDGWREDAAVKEPWLADIRRETENVSAFFAALHAGS